jgi:hypothetical protein
MWNIDAYALMPNLEIMIIFGHYATGKKDINFSETKDWVPAANTQNTTSGGERKEYHNIMSMILTIPIQARPPSDALRVSPTP